MTRSSIDFQDQTETRAQGSLGPKLTYSWASHGYSSGYSWAKLSPATTRIKNKWTKPVLVHVYIFIRYPVFSDIYKKVMLDILAFCAIFWHKLIPPYSYTHLCLRKEKQKTQHITHSAITTPYYQKNKYSFVHFELEFNIWEMADRTLWLWATLPKNSETSQDQSWIRSGDSVENVQRLSLGNVILILKCNI